jgi:hypothetical protein
MLSLPLPRLPARADVLAALHSDRYPPGHRIHVRARSGGQRRLADELPGELVNRMRQRQAEARTRELREQITPAACHSADLGDRVRANAGPASPDDDRGAGMARQV